MVNYLTKLFIFWLVLIADLKPFSVHIFQNRLKQSVDQLKVPISLSLIIIWLLIFDCFLVYQRCFQCKIAYQIGKCQMIQRNFIIKELSPNLWGLHVLSHIINSTFQNSLALFLILILKIVILNREVNEPLPEFDLGSVVSDRLFISKKQFWFNTIWALLFLSLINFAGLRRQCDGILINVIVVEWVNLCNLLYTLYVLFTLLLMFILL